METTSTILNLWKLKLKRNKLYFLLKLDNCQNKTIISKPFKGQDFNSQNFEKEEGFTYEIQKVGYDPNTKESIEPTLIIR